MWWIRRCSGHALRWQNHPVNSVFRLRSGGERGVRQRASRKVKCVQFSRVFHFQVVRSDTELFHVTETVASRGPGRKFNWATPRKPLSALTILLFVYNAPCLASYLYKVLTTVPSWLVMFARQLL